MGLCVIRWIYCWSSHCTWEWVLTFFKVFANEMFYTR